jgi:lycopene cyclase domain-containing protein
MEYTIAATISVGAAAALDHLLRTRILRTRRFWIFMAVMFGFKTIVNGYLTWRPIVLYGEGFSLGVRVFTIPIEDYLYGFALITASVVVWEYLRRRVAGQ